MGAHNRSTRLNGLFPLAYVGVNPTSPENFLIFQRPPTTTDIANFLIGDLWLDNTSEPTPPTAANLWILVSKTNGIATWVNFVGSVVTMETLTGNSGGAVGVDGANNINVVGDGTTITIAGVPATHTLTASLVNSSITLSNGNNITITGSPVSLGGTATVNVSGTTQHSLLLGNATGSINNLGVASSGQLPIGSTGADPVLATLTAGTGITITNGAGSITIAAAGSDAQSFPTDSGTATPAAGVLNILTDGKLINTSGAGHTVTINSVFANATFTPVLAFGGGTTGITYVTQLAEYTKIGNVVFFSLTIVLSSKGSSTGAATVTTLPFTPATVGTNTFITFSNLTFTANFTSGVASISAGSTTISLNQQGSAQANTNLSDTNFANNTGFTTQGFFFTS